MEFFSHYLIAMAFMPALLLLWIGVQYLSRKYAEAHPEFGPAREEGGGCGSRGGPCACTDGKKCAGKT